MDEITLVHLGKNSLEEATPRQGGLNSAHVKSSVRAIEHSEGMKNKKFSKEDHEEGYRLNKAAQHHATKVGEHQLATIHQALAAHHAKEGGIKPSETDSEKNKDAPKPKTEDGATVKVPRMHISDAMKHIQSVKDKKDPKEYVEFTADTKEKKNRPYKMHFHVEQNIKGKGMGYKPEDHGLIHGHDATANEGKGGYRQVKKENIRSIKKDGIDHDVVHEEIEGPVTEGFPNPHGKSSDALISHTNKHKSGGYQGDRDSEIDFHTGMMRAHGEFAHGNKMSKISKEKQLLHSKLKKYHSDHLNNMHNEDDPEGKHAESMLEELNLKLAAARTLFESIEYLPNIQEVHTLSGLMSPDHDWKSSSDREKEAQDKKFWSKRSRRAIKNPKTTKAQHTALAKEADSYGWHAAADKHHNKASETEESVEERISDSKTQIDGKVPKDASEFQVSDIPEKKKEFKGSPSYHASERAFKASSEISDTKNHANAADLHRKAAKASKDAGLHALSKHHEGIAAAHEKLASESPKSSGQRAYELHQASKAWGGHKNPRTEAAKAKGIGSGLVTPKPKPDQVKDKDPEAYGSARQPAVKTAKKKSSGFDMSAHKKRAVGLLKSIGAHVSGITSAITSKLKPATESIHPLVAPVCADQKTFFDRMDKKISEGMDGEQAWQESIEENWSNDKKYNNLRMSTAYLDHKARLSTKEANKRGGIHAHETAYNAHKEARDWHHDALKHATGADKNHHTGEIKNHEYSMGWHQKKIKDANNNANLAATGNAHKIKTYSDRKAAIADANEESVHPNHFALLSEFANDVNTKEAHAEAYRAAISSTTMPKDQQKAMAVHHKIAERTANEVDSLEVAQKIAEAAACSNSFDLLTQPKEFAGYHDKISKVKKEKYKVGEKKTEKKSMKEMLSLVSGRPIEEQVDRETAIQEEPLRVEMGNKENAGKNSNPVPSKTTYSHNYGVAHFASLKAHRTGKPEDHKYAAEMHERAMNSATQKADKSYHEEKIHNHSKIASAVGEHAEHTSTLNEGTYKQEGDKISKDADKENTKDSHRKAYNHFWGKTSDVRGMKLSPDAAKRHNYHVDKAAYHKEKMDSLSEAYSGPAVGEQIEEGSHVKGYDKASIKADELSKKAMKSKSKEDHGAAYYAHANAHKMTDDKDDILDHERQMEYHANKAGWMSEAYSGPASPQRRVASSKAGKAAAMKKYTVDPVTVKPTNPAKGTKG